MYRDVRCLSLALVALLALSLAPPARADAPAGQVIWAFGSSLPPAWFAPAEATGTLIPFSVYYALHDRWSSRCPERP